MLAIPAFLSLIQPLTARHAAPGAERSPQHPREMAVARPSPAPDGRKPVALALQGGGAHGAFTWGVLDHLLADGRLDIRALSGASAGAMNAVMVADGLMRGGPDAARERLEQFWRASSVGGRLPAEQQTALDRMMAWVPSPASPVQAYARGLARMFSPYELNPLNINPLRDLIAEAVDFDGLRQTAGVDLYISATNVHSGEARIFSRAEVTADAVMASAALPLLFRAVEIDGIPYWDGGYGANPPVLPLAQAHPGVDVIVVQINPLARTGTPSTTQDIVDRINEITFSASLAAELRTLRTIDGMIESGALRPADGYRPTNLHRIALEAGPRVTPASRLNNDFAFLQMLHRAGRRAARRFLDAHFDDIGVRGTLSSSREAA